MEKTVMKGLLVSLGSVALFYAALYFYLSGIWRDTGIGKMLMVLWMVIFPPDPRGLTATAGGSPSLFGYLSFWLWAMIVFAVTFLIYLRRT